MKAEVTPVVAAVVVQHDPLRVLLHKKVEATRNPELCGLWEFPGGMMEYGETPEQCVEREVREETGLPITVHNVISARTNIYEDGRHYLVLYYLCSTSAPEASAKDCQWVSLRSLRYLHCLAGTKEVLADLCQGIMPFRRIWKLTCGRQGR